MKIVKVICSAILFFIFIAAIALPVVYAGHFQIIEKTNVANTRLAVLRKETDSVKQSVVKKSLKHKKKFYTGIGYPNPHPTDDDCVFTEKYTVHQRLQRYPFSKASKILAVSFETFDLRPDVLIDDTIPQIISDTIFTSSIHVLNGVLNYSSLKEVKELDSVQINKLTDIIYNTRVKKPNRYASMGFSCYNPRNGLVFFDNKGRVFDYLQVCFECERFNSQSDRIGIGTWCNQKYELLRVFFKEVGLNFGTDKRD